MANQYESAARAAKAHKLASAYVAAMAKHVGVPVSTAVATAERRALLAQLAAAMASEVDVWVLVANGARLNPPSKATIDSAVAILQSQAKAAARYEGTDPFEGLP